MAEPPIDDTDLSSTSPPASPKTWSGAKKLARDWAGKCAGICPCLTPCLPVQEPPSDSGGAKLTRANSTAFKKPDYKKKIVAQALRTCGVCVRFAEGTCGVRCTTGSTRRNLGLPQPTGDREKIFKSGALDLVNDFLEKEWKHISDWFQKKMKNAVEPILKKNISDSLVLTVSDLGTWPAEILHLESFKVVSSFPGQDENKESIMLVGKLEYEGDGNMQVDLRAAGADVAKVTVTNLKIEGPIIIEFVRMIDVPPWFSGMRIYFPDAPQIDMDVQMEVILVDYFYDTAQVVKGRIMQSLKNIIGNAAVAPNAFCVDFNKGLDPFRLRHKQPEGILRMQLVRKPLPEEEEAAVGVRATLGRWMHKSHAQAPRSTSDYEDDADGDGSVAGAPPPNAAAVPAAPVPAWRRWLPFGRAAEEPTGQGDVELLGALAIGHESKTLKLEETADIFVQDLKRQNVRLVLRDGKKQVDLGRQEFKIDDLISSQDGENPSEKEITILPARSREEGPLVLKSEWRKCADIDPTSMARALELSLSNMRWSVGPAEASTWALLVDLQHASGVPVEAGTQVWVTIEIRHRQSYSNGINGATPASIIEPQHSWPIEASAPVQRVIDLFNTMGEFAGGFPPEAAAALRRVNPEVWRRSLGVSSAPNSSGEMDVIWIQPFRLMMNSEGSLLESIKSLEVVVTLKRPDRGKLRDPSINCKREKILGQASWKLANLVSRDDYCEDVALQVPLLSPARGTATSSATVRVRFQVRPLEAAKDLKSLQGETFPGILARNVRRSVRHFIGGGNNGMHSDEEDMEEVPSNTQPGILQRLMSRRSIMKPIDGDQTPPFEGNHQQAGPALASVPEQEAEEEKTTETAPPQPTGNFLVRWWRNRGAKATPSPAAVDGEEPDDVAEGKERVGSGEILATPASTVGGEGAAATNGLPKSALKSPKKSLENGGKHVQVSTEPTSPKNGQGDTKSLSVAVRRDLDAAAAQASEDVNLVTSPTNAAAAPASSGDLSPVTWGTRGIFMTPGMKSVAQAASRM